MKSKISFYNIGVGKNLLKRFWPLWTVYFLLLLVLLPMEILGRDFANWITPETINEIVLDIGVGMVPVSFAACILIAMAMFGYLYNGRSCCLMNSLPLRRETMFLTACITGLAPMLLADVLCFGITALLFAGNEALKLSVLGTWLAVVVMENIAFFEMAVFCAMLTGNIAALPMLYVLLNVAAYAAEGAATLLLRMFLYGFVRGNEMLTPLSPLVKLNSVMRASASYETVDGVSTMVEGSLRIQGMKWLAAYCAAGLVLLVAALMIYRKRRMETAGDTVAVNALKPVFQYAIALGTAVLFASFLSGNVFSSLTGTKAGIFAAAMLVLGAPLGWILAEMIMRKTLKIFPMRWKGALICAGILAAAGLLCEFDVLGYETRVPEADEVESIYCFLTSDNIKQEQNIQDFIALHRQIIAGKAENEAGGGERMELLISYQLKNGSRLRRTYALDASQEAANDENSDIRKWQTIMNSDEVRGYRTCFDIPVSRETIGNCYVSKYIDNGADGGWNQDIILTPEQALALYFECIVPDIEDGRLGEFFVAEDEEYYERKTDTTVTIETIDRSWTGQSDKNCYNSISFNVQTDSARCIEWLKANTGITPEALRKPEEAKT